MASSGSPLLSLPADRVENSLQVMTLSLLPRRHGTNRMRNRRTIGAVALSGFLLVLYLRQHICILGDMTRTYSTFHALLESHPDILYRYPWPLRKVDQLPKIIHQVALGSVNITKYHDAINSCRALHPTWQFNLWTDTNGTAFMAENYPEILPHYTGYHQDIQRANILRYGVLHTYGGVYFDLDMTCMMALDETPLVNLPFVTPGAHPVGVNNAFILAQPGHAFLSHLLNAVASHDLYWGLPMRLPYTENMLSAGCMFFLNAWMAYSRDVFTGLQDEKVYILADKNGDMEPHMWRGVAKSPIMSHSGDSSWHSWDAAAMLIIGRYSRLIIVVLGIWTIAAMAVALRMCSRAGVRYRKVWRKQKHFEKDYWE